MFVLKSGDNLTLVLVYVDDIIITGNNEASISFVKSFINSRFHIKDLGLLKYFLGIEPVLEKVFSYHKENKLLTC